MELSDRQWDKFIIQDLFDVEIGQAIDGNKIYKNGGLKPYVTRKESNNGLDGFIEYEEKYYNISFPVITIGNETAKPYVHVYPFFTGTKVNIMKPKFTANKDRLLFICISLEMHKSKYSYSYTINSTRLKKQSILLPVDDNGNPDFEFMEQYIRDTQFQKVIQYINHCKKIVSKLGDAVQIPAFSEIEWKPYRINKIAEVGSGRDIYDAERSAGDLPYITAGVQNNGIGYFVGNTNKTLTKNAISISRNGAGVGNSFFHEYPALYSNDCRKVILNDYNENKFVSLFITNQIMLQRKNYNYSRKMGTARLKRQKIMLPAISYDKPDFNYMEQYIKNLMLKKYKDYITYAEKKVSEMEVISLFH